MAVLLNIPAAGFANAAPLNKAGARVIHAGVSASHSAVVLSHRHKLSSLANRKDLGRHRAREKLTHKSKLAGDAVPHRSASILSLLALEPNSSPAAANDLAPEDQPSCDVPSAVDDVTATAGPNEDALSWSAASSPDSPLTAYEVREISGSNVGQAQANDGTETSITLTGLAGGVAAVFSVTAQNACGAGPSTNSPSATPSGSGTTYASAVIADAPSEYYRLGDTSGTVMADSSAYALDGQYGSQTELGQPGALPSNPNASSIYYPGYYGEMGVAPHFFHNLTTRAP